MAFYGHNLALSEMCTVRKCTCKCIQYLEAIHMILSYSRLYTLTVTYMFQFVTAHMLAASPPSLLAQSRKPRRQARLSGSATSSRAPARPHASARAHTAPPLPSPGPWP